MQMMNRKTAAQILSIFNDCYPGKVKQTENTVKIWLHMLKDLDANAVLAAAYHLCSTRPDWPPDIATVRQTVVNLTHGEAHQKTGQDAWERIMMKIQDETIELSAMEKKALKQVSTIYDLRRSTNAASDRAQYIKAFDHLVRRQQNERVTLPEVKALVDRNAPALPESKTPEQLPEDTQDDSDLIPAKRIRAFAETFGKLIDLKEGSDREKRRVEKEALDRR